MSREATSPHCFSLPEDLNFWGPWSWIQGPCYKNKKSRRFEEFGAAAMDSDPLVSEVPARSKSPSRSCITAHVPIPSTAPLGGQPVLGPEQTQTFLAGLPAASFGSFDRVLSWGLTHAVPCVSRLFSKPLGSLPFSSCRSLLLCEVLRDVSAHLILLAYLMVSCSSS